MEPPQRTRTEPAPLPPKEFDEAFYFATYPDVAAAVQAGRFASGYEHFVAFGIRKAA